METQKQLKVYTCPFCIGQVYFNNSEDFERHLYKTHIRESIHYTCIQCLKKISKIQHKWGLV